LNTGEVAHLQTMHRISTNACVGGKPKTRQRCAPQAGHEVLEDAAADGRQARRDSERARVAQEGRPNNGRRAQHSDAQTHNAQ
jgi:hypothetical protein